MPELRSGARRSRRLGDLHPDPQTANQEDNIIAPAQARTRRRGRGRANATAVAKAGTPTRPTAAGRGRGVRLIDLEPDQPGGILPETAGLEAPEVVVKRVEGLQDKNIVMAGGSRDKIMGVEDDSNTTPVPERVISCLELHQICFLIYYEYTP